MLHLWILLLVMNLHVVENTLFRNCDDRHFAGRNIALGQETEQSGDYYDEIASNAVDGNTDTSSEYGTCAHSSPSKGSSWWRVNFDKPYIIAGIIIYSRSNENNRFRLKNFEVTGFVEGSNEGRTLYNDSKLQQYTERIIMLRIDKYDNVKFKSAMISVPPNSNIWVDEGNSMLTVCEVEIYTLVSKNWTVKDQMEGEVTDTNKSEEYFVVGAISGVGGAVIATMVLMTIWFFKYRRIPKEMSYTDLDDVNRNAQSYDQITPGANGPTDVQLEMYEIVV